MIFVLFVFLVLQSVLSLQCVPGNCSSVFHNFTNTKDNATYVFNVGYLSFCAEINYASAAEWVLYNANKNNSILTDIRVDLYVQDVCTPIDVIVAMNELITQKKIKMLIVEAPEYFTAIAVQTASAFGVPSVAVNSMSELLDNKQVFNQLFSRLSTPTSLQSDAILETINYLGIREVLFVYSNDVYGSQTYLAFAGKAVQWKIVVRPLAIDSGTVPPVSQVVVDSRALIFATNPSEGLPYLIALRNAGIYGTTYFYMFSLSMARALSYRVSEFPMVDGSLIIVAQRYIVGQYFTEYFYGWNNSDHYMFPGDRSAYALPTIDAATIIVDSLNSLILQGYTEDNITGVMLNTRILDMQHDSAVGVFRFNSNNDRVANFTLYNVRLNYGKNVTYNITDVALYDTRSQSVCFYPIALIYYNGSTVNPVFVPRFSDLCSFEICHFRGNCTSAATCKCDQGYSGQYCETRVDKLIERDRFGSRTIVAWVVPVSIFVIAVLLSMYIFLRKRKAALLKGITEKQRSEIPRDDIKLLDRIGRGAAGEVSKAMFRGTEVAVKRLVSATSSKSAVEEFMLETAIMCALRHPNIVLFMGSSYDPVLKEMLLVMEYMARGSVHDVIHNKKINMPYELQLHIVLQAAQGMNFLHSSNPPVIHRDLKSHNILLDDKWNARISDFGITRFKEINKGENGKKRSKVAPSSMGTVFWTAPEVLSGGSHSESSDCYSFGIVLWEIFHRSEPFMGIDTMVVATEVTSKARRPDIAPACPNEIKDLMRACWHQEPSKRPYFQDVVNSLRSLTALHPIHNIDSQTNISRVEAPIGTVYFVNTELPDAYELWEAAPRAFQQAMKLHNQLVRMSLESCGGYEVSNSGSSFLGSFPTLQAALDWSFTMHTTLLHAQWPKQLLSLPATMERKTESGELIWRGPRMRIAIHAGTTHSEPDHLRGCVVYSGPVVDRVQSMLRESDDIGDIVVSGAIHTEIQEKKIHLNAMQIHHIGKYDDMDYYVLVNASLANRRPHGSLLPLLPQYTSGAENSIEARAMAKEPKWLVKWKSLEIQQSLGPGTVGEFYRAVCNYREVAVKCLINQKVIEDDILELVSNTVILSRINHPNLLPFYGICLEEGHLAIITEYAANGNLRALLNDESIPLPLAKRLRMAKEIAAGMTFLSMHPDPALRVHDNFKSHNIMVTADWTIKIADFGQASVKDLCRTMTSVTNVAWTAPEVLEGEPLTNNSSLYSFGIILWEIITRKIPYKNEHPIKVVNKIIGGHRPPVPKEGIPQQYKDLMESCWHPYGNMRPSWHVINSELSFILDGLPQ